MTLLFICFPFASILENGMPKITKRIVDGARPEARDLFIWDSELHGFGLRVRPGDRRSFIFQSPTLEGRRRHDQ